MLFIHAISYCLEEIQQHLNDRLGLSEQMDYETALCKKFAVEYVEDHAKRVPSAVLKGVPRIETKQQEMQPQSMDEEASENTDKSSEPLEENWTDIPEMGADIIKEQAFYKQSASYRQLVSLDETALRFGGCWGDLVNSTYDEFAHIFKNNLKKEGLTDIKMLVLARYARQLQIIKIWGVKILEARETRLLALQGQAEDAEKLKQEFLEKSVDTWLLALITAATEEATLFLANALKATTTTLFWGVSYSSTPGKTEDMLFACCHTMTALYNYIAGYDVESYNKFLDIFPGYLDTKNALAICTKDLIPYLIANWFNEGMYLAHCERGTLLDADLYTFDPEKAKTKREQVKSLIEQMDRLEHKSLDSNDRLCKGYWRDAGRVVESIALNHANHLTTSKSFLMRYFSPDRLPVILDKIQSKYNDQVRFDIEGSRRRI